MKVCPVVPQMRTSLITAPVLSKLIVTLCYHHTV
uniref:Uncharacterized protein n=1 Tax=Salmonella phage PMBT31 TaxID=3153514 RepID=A0AAU8GP26_9CAUD